MITKNIKIYQGAATVAAITASPVAPAHAFDFGGNQFSANPRPSYHIWSSISDNAGEIEI